jgi:hypothetical protein
MADKFENYRAELNSPYAEAADIAPSDSTDLSTTTRAIYIGGGSGVLVATMKSGATVTFSGLVTGSVLPIRARRVLATGTTATDLVALW